MNRDLSLADLKERSGRTLDHRPKLRIEAPDQPLLAIGR
jgi:hypothetical protein